MFRVWGEERALKMSHSYKDLIVWQRARTLAGEVYRATEGFPAKEVYGLTSQMRRAAVSVVSNIAEGQGRLTKGEFQQFLGHARGSLLELESQIAIALDLKYLDTGESSGFESKTVEVRRLLNGLIESLRARSTAAKSESTRSKLET
jgi:four helix bundle protein